MSDPLTHDRSLDPGLIDFLGERLRASLANLMALYGFGSRFKGAATSSSDLDLAVLVEGFADSVTLWELAGELADHVGCEVDLVDLRAASTVMQHQIVTTGQRLWARDARADLFESFVLSEKTALDEARADLLADIAKDGRIHG